MTKANQVGPRVRWSWCIRAGAMTNSARRKITGLLPGRVTLIANLVSIHAGRYGLSGTTTYRSMTSRTACLRLSIFLSLQMLRMIEFSAKAAQTGETFRRRVRSVKAFAGVTNCADRVHISGTIRGRKLDQVTVSAIFV